MKHYGDIWHCPMINSSDECCLLTEEQHDMYEGVMDQVQAAFCPLVDIPPHGRLIDADKFERIKYEIPIKPANYNRGFDEGVKFVQKLIMDAPTIIPSDKEE